MKVVEKAFFNSSENLAQALIEYATFGNESRFLKKPSLKEFRKLKGEDLVSLFRALQQCACTVHYCGNLPQEKVAKMAARCEFINPDVKPAPQELQDKHYYRKHGANAYYGQNNN